MALARQRVARLVDIAELDRVADAKAAAIGGILRGDQLEQGRFAGAVRPDHPDDPARRQAEIERLDQQPVAKALGDPFGADHQFAEPRPRRQYDLRRLGGLFAALGDQRFIGRQPRLALCLARPRALPHPFELALEGALARFFLPAFDGEALLLLFEPARIIPLERDAAAAIEFEDPARDLVEKVAVMGDGHDGARVILQKPLQPGDRFGVEMIGRLVEQQQIRALQ